MANSEYLDLQRRPIEGQGTAGLIRIYDDGTECYIAIKYTASANIARGEVVCFDQSNNQRVKPCPTAGSELDMPIGVATAAIASASSGWVAILGLVYVLPEGGVTATKGYQLYCSSTTAGTVNQTNAPSTPTHWREVGHWYEDGSGAGALARAQIHFN